MNLGLAARLGLVFAALVAFTALLTSAAGVISTNSQVRNDIDRFLRDRAAEFTDGTRQSPRDRGRSGGRDRPSDNLTAEAVDEATNSLAEADAEVQLLDQDGNVERQLGIALPIEAVDLKLAEERGTRLRTVTVDGVDYRMITQHLEGVGAVQIARDLGDTNALLSAIRRQTFLIGLAMSALAGVVGWLLARRQTQPLSALTRSVEQVATTQDLSTVIEVNRTDEIGRLASSFDRMLRALARSRDQQHQLVQDAAHELRTPLTSINANVDLLARADDLEPATRQSMLTSVRSELGQLNELFTEIIELATDARDAPSFDRIDLADVAAAAIAGFSARSSRTVELERRPSPVIGDPVSLERAMGNLLSNAEKYSPADAAISVTVADGTVTVRDRGPGVPPDEIERVFDRFYRSDEARSQPGSGLGLAIVDKIVGDHGGRPFLTNAADGGAVAGFSLPAAADFG